MLVDRETKAWSF